MQFIQFSLSGLDEFLVYFGLSLVFVAIFLTIYVRITPYREFALIREGNPAAAASLSGSLIGFVLPLASAVIHSVHPYDMAIWAAIALVVQLIAFFVVRVALLPQLGRDIPEGKVASGVFLGAASLAAGVLNAAAMTY
jgi:putative membrane protein